MPTVFELGGVPVGVEADLDDRRWLAGFGGCRECPEAQGAPFRIVFEPASGPLPAPEAGADPRVAFALDSGPLRMPVVARGDVTRAWDETTGAVLELTEGGATTRIRYPGDRRAARLLLLRVAREYAHNRALEDGDVILHAAGVVEDGRVRAIAGPKRAGKTTLALRLMASGRRYLANDRLRLSPDGRGIGIPTVVTLRPGTQALFPELEARLRRGVDYRLHAAEAVAAPPREDAAGLRVSPAQLCAAFGQIPAPSGVLDAILFLDPRADSPRALAPDAAAAALIHGLLGHAGGVHASELFRSGPAPSAAQLRQRCEALAARVPCSAGRP
jgi:hypothetical protein